MWEPEATGTGPTVFMLHGTATYTFHLNGDREGNLGTKAVFATRLKLIKAANKNLSL